MINQELLEYDYNNIVEKILKWLFYIKIKNIFLDVFFQTVDKDQ